MNSITTSTTTTSSRSRRLTTITEEVLSTFLGLIHTVSSSSSLTTTDPTKTRILYPGSAMIARLLGRAQDSMLLYEKSSEQCELLTHTIRNNIPNITNTTTQESRIAIRNADGYTGLLEYSQYTSALPRGLIFIDPPYQYGSDTERIVHVIQRLKQVSLAVRTARDLVPHVPRFPRQK